MYIALYIIFLFWDRRPGSEAHPTPQTARPGNELPLFEPPPGLEARFSRSKPLRYFPASLIWRACEGCHGVSGGNCWHMYVERSLFWDMSTVITHVNLEVTFQKK